MFAFHQPLIFNFSANSPISSQPSHSSPAKLPLTFLPQLSPLSLLPPFTPLAHPSQSCPPSHTQSYLLPLLSHLHLITPPPQILNCLLPLSTSTTEPFLLLIRPPPLALLQSPTLFQQLSLPPTSSLVLPSPSSPFPCTQSLLPSLFMNSVDLKYPEPSLKPCRSFHTGCH